MTIFENDPVLFLYSEIRDEERLGPALAHRPSTTGGAS